MIPLLSNNFYLDDTMVNFPFEKSTWEDQFELHQDVWKTWFKICSSSHASMYLLEESPPPFKLLELEFVESICSL